MSSLLISLLKSHDWESAMKLIETTPSAISLVSSQTEDPSLFYTLSSYDMSLALLSSVPEAAWSRNRGGDLPLHAACQLASGAKVIDLLLERHPEGPSCKNSDGKLPLHNALSNPNNDLSLIIKLLSAYPQAVIEKEAKNGSFALHYASAFKAHEEIVSLLLESYPRAAEQKDNQGFLPLHLALIYGSSTEAIMLLLNAYPAASRCVDAKMRLPLHLAAQFHASSQSISNIVALFPEAIDTPITAAPQSQHVASSGATASVFSPQKSSASRQGVAAGGAGSSSSGGGGSNINNWAVGKKPIHLAIKYHATEAAIASLMSATETVVVASSSSLTRVNGQIVVAEKVASEAASVMDESVVCNGDALLHTALEFNASLAAIEALIKCRPSIVREYNHDGKLPIHFAAWHQAPHEIVSVLLKHYAEGAKIKDKLHGNYALHYAIQYAPQGPQADCRPALVILSSFPAAVFSANNFGLFPIHLAAQFRAPVRLLDALIKVAPFSTGFEDETKWKYLALDYALHHNATAEVISRLLGVPKEVHDEKKPIKSTTSHLQKMLNASKGRKEAAEEYKEEEEEEEEKAWEEPQPFVSLKDAVLELQHRCKEQGEEMRAIRKRLHEQTLVLQAKIDENKNQHREIGWRKDRIKILEREIEALRHEMATM